MCIKNSANNKNIPSIFLLYARCIINDFWKLDYSVNGSYHFCCINVKVMMWIYNDVFHDALIRYLATSMFLLHVDNYTLISKKVFGWLCFNFHISVCIMLNVFKQNIRYLIRDIRIHINFWSLRMIHMYYNNNDDNKLGILRTTKSNLPYPVHIFYLAYLHLRHSLANKKVFVLWGNHLKSRYGPSFFSVFLSKFFWGTVSFEDIIDTYSDDTRERISKND